MSAREGDAVLSGGAGSSSDTTSKAEERAVLLDEEGDLSGAFVKTLARVFRRFSHAAREYGQSQMTTEGLPEEGAGSLGQLTLTEEELDEFTRTVNGGQVMDQASKDEMKQYLQVDTKGNLTFTGFCEMYHLQTGSDAEETWRDLKALGYNEQLHLTDKSID